MHVENLQHVQCDQHAHAVHRADPHGDTDMPNGQTDTNDQTNPHASNVSSDPDAPISLDAPIGLDAQTDPDEWNLRTAGMPHGGSPYRDPDTLAAGEILHVPTGTVVEREAFHDLLAERRIVYVGEGHDNIHDHRFELEIIRALHRRHPGKLAVGMEMFGRAGQADIDRWLVDELSEREFVRIFGRDWGVPDYAYYREILAFIRAEGIPLRALNIGRDERLAALTARREANGGAWPQPDDPYQRQALAAMFAGHAGGHGDPGMFPAMHGLWEDTMAAAVIDWLDRPENADGRMVVLTGGFHVAHGFGIPRRVFRQRPWSYTVVLTHTPPELEESEPIRMEVDFPDLPLYIADWISCVPFRSLREVRPRLGVTLEETAAGVVVTGVKEHLPGAVAGVAAGDAIVAIDGAPVSEVFDLQYGLLHCRPGGTTTVVVRRHGAEWKLTVSFPPAP